MADSPDYPYTYDPEKHSSTLQQDDKDDGIKTTTQNDQQAVEIFDSMAGEEEVHDIKYRTMSWQRMTVLLFGDQVWYVAFCVNNHC